MAVLPEIMLHKVVVEDVGLRIARHPLPSRPKSLSEHG